MKKTFLNIVLVCLDGDFCRYISKELSDKLDMFFADLKDYIEYDLLDSKAILEKCGVNYLQERELKATKSFSKFENTVLTVDFDLFKQNCFAFDEESLIVYLKLPKKVLGEKETINIISYESHDEFLVRQSDVIVSLKSKSSNKAVKEIIEKLREAL